MTATLLLAVAIGTLEQFGVFALGFFLGRRR